MNKEKHEKADGLRTAIIGVRDFLRRVELAIKEGDQLKFSVTFSECGGWFSDFSRDTMKVVLVLEKQRLESKLSTLENEYESL